MAKESSTYRLSDEAKKLLVLMAVHMGNSQTDVVEYAIRELARKLEIKIDRKESGENGNGVIA